MTKRFLLAGLAASVANLVLHAIAHFLFLKDFYRSHPAGSEEFVRQLDTARAVAARAAAAVGGAGATRVAPCLGPARLRARRTTAGDRGSAGPRAA
jgi:hypothetical protein